jgi:hypothetical protein
MEHACDFIRTISWRLPQGFLDCFENCANDEDPSNTILAAPRSYRKLDYHQFDELFRHVAQKEYREIWGKGCFTKTTRTTQTADAEVLPLMWVFTYKFDEDGFLYRFKARLVIRGDLQQPYGDTYAATLAARTFRALVAIANQFGLEFLQYDARNVFLNATFNRELYAETPDGFKKDGELLPTASMTSWDLVGWLTDRIDGINGDSATEGGGYIAEHLRLGCKNTW